MDEGDLAKVTRNVGWMLGGRLATMAIGMAASILVARHLGPDGFGVLSLALSVVGFFAFLSYLGLNPVVTKRLVEGQQSAGTILGSAFVLRMGGALVAMVLVAVTAWAIGVDATSALVIGVVSLTLLIDISGVFDLWFQSKVESRYSIYAQVGSVLLGALLKAGLVFAEAPIWAFAVAIAAQAALRAGGFVIAYTATRQSVMAWRVSWTEMMSLLGTSWPLIVSSAGALVYLKVDQIMLGYFLDDAAVGVYSAAASMSEVWYFIPNAVALSIFPKFVQTRGDADRYRALVQKTFAATALMANVVVIVILISAPVVIETLYGVAYEDSISILRLHILACPAVFMGAVLSQWLVAEELLKFSMTRHGIGAVANVGLNIYLVPRMGGEGAAIATVVSYSLASYLSCFTDRRTWTAGVMMTRALFKPFASLRG